MPILRQLKLWSFFYQSKALLTMQSMHKRTSSSLQFHRQLHRQWKQDDLQVDDTGTVGLGYRYECYFALCILSDLNESYNKEFHICFIMIDLEQYWNFCMDIQNIYLDLYNEHRIEINEGTAMENAEKLSTQIAMLYNTFGYVIKDLVKLLGHLYHQKQNKTTLKSSPIQASQTSLPVVEQQYPQLPALSQILKVQQQRQKTKNSNINIKKYKYQYSENADNVNNKSQNEKKSEEYGRRIKVKNKKQREQLTGYSCLMCEKFYKAVDQDFKIQNQMDRLCDRCSKHRSNHPATNYFNNFTQQFNFDD